MSTPYRKRSTNARGYGSGHKARRRQLAPLVAAGLEKCSRCGEPIEPGQAWDLDHADDRNCDRGVSHATCNRSAGAAKVNGGMTPGVTRGTRWSRVWWEPVPPEVELTAQAKRAR